MYKHHTFPIISQYDPKFEVCYLLPYILYLYDFAQCRCDVGSHGILVSMYLGELCCPGAGLITTCRCN